MRPILFGIIQVGRHLLPDAITATPWANNYIGQPVYDYDLTQETYMRYPFDETYIKDSDLRNNQILIGRAVITPPWVKGLTYEINFSNTNDRIDQAYFAPVTTKSGESYGGSGSKSSTVESGWLLNNIVTYNGTFNDHKLNATLLYSREKRKSNSTTAQSDQYANEALGYNNLGLGVISTVNSSAWEENSLSYMGRINYVFKDRYMLTGTVRRDGYSGFGEDNKFANFPFNINCMGVIRGTIF